MPQKHESVSLIEITWHSVPRNLSCYLRMDVHVLLQADSVAEGFPADVATKWPRAAVGPPDVDLESMRCGEHLLFFCWLKKTDLFRERPFLLCGGKKPCRSWKCWPCHRWCSDTCWRLGSNVCYSPGAAAAVCCGRRGYRTCRWHAATLWGWSSLGGDRRKQAVTPKHTSTCSRTENLPHEALRLHTSTMFQRKRKMHEKIIGKRPVAHRSGSRTAKESKTVVRDPGEQERGSPALLAPVWWNDSPRGTTGHLSETHR